MNLKLSRKIKLLSVAGLLVIALVFVALGWLGEDSEQEVEQTVLEYALTPNIDILTNLKPNEIYQKNYLTDDQVVITSLLKDMKINSAFMLSSEQADSISLTVKQNEYIAAYYGEDKQVLWQRNMQPKQISQAGEGQVIIENERIFDPENFKNFLARVTEKHKIDFVVAIYAEWQVTGELKKGDSVIPIEQTYRVDLPLFDKMFKIDKTEIVAISDKTSEMVTVQQPADEASRLPFGIAALVAFGLAIAVLVLIKDKSTTGNYQQQIAQNHTKYAEQLSQIDNRIIAEQPIKVSSFEDLVKVANELRQPICYYRDSSNALESTTYYVFDQQRTYLFVLQESEQDKATEAK